MVTPLPGVVNVMFWLSVALPLRVSVFALVWPRVTL